MARIVRWLSVVVMVCGCGHCQDTFVSTDTGPSDGEGATVPKAFQDKLLDAQLSLPVGLRRFWWPGSQANHGNTTAEGGVSDENATLVTLSQDPRVNDEPLQHVDGASSASLRGVDASTTTRMGGTSTKLDPSCLRYLSCHSDIRNIDFQHLEIHFWDLPERSAEACAAGCLALRPSTRLVLAKMIAMNERLVCGCGEPSAITGQGGGVLNDSQFCSPCPDGEHKCGGVVSVSVYTIARACRPTSTPPTGVDTTPATERLVPHGLSYSGCFGDEGVFPSTTVAALKSPKRSVVACADYCRGQLEDSDLVFVRYRKTQDRLICSCGRSETSLASASRLEDTRCQTVCPDGGDVCGGPDAVSVYSSAPMVKFSPLSLLLLLLMLLTPSADGAKAFHLFG